MRVLGIETSCDETAVAIIEADKNWCMDTDGDFRFRVEVDGTGTGNYAFGVWARPK